MTTGKIPTRRIRHPVKLETSVTRSGGIVLDTIVTDLSLDGCCLAGHFHPGELLDLRIRSVGKFPGQVRWARMARAGVRFLERHRATDPSSLLRDSKGVAAIEYAFLAALIAVSLVAAISSLGGAVGNAFSDIDTAVENPPQYTNGDDED